jgi:arginase family enzyme
MALPVVNPAQVYILGLPVDENSSFARGPALAPGHIRAALHSGSSNLSTENGLDVENETSWQDLGNMQLSSGAEGRSKLNPSRDVNEMTATAAAKFYKELVSRMMVEANS